MDIDVCDLRVARNVLNKMTLEPRCNSNEGINPAFERQRSKNGSVSVMDEVRKESRKAGMERAREREVRRPGR